MGYPVIYPRMPIEMLISCSEIRIKGIAEDIYCCFYVLKRFIKDYFNFDPSFEYWKEYADFRNITNGRFSLNSANLANMWGKAITDWKFRGSSGLRNLVQVYEESLPPYRGYLANTGKDEITKYPFFPGVAYLGADLVPTLTSLHVNNFSHDCEFVMAEATRVS